MAKEKHNGRGVHSRRGNRDVRAGSPAWSLENAAYWAAAAQGALAEKAYGEAAFCLGRAQGWIEEAQAGHQSVDELHPGDAGQEAQVSGPEHAD